MLPGATAQPSKRFAVWSVATAHADLNAAINIAARWGDVELRACTDRKEVKALLEARHQAWKHQNGWP